VIYIYLDRFDRIHCSSIAFSYNAMAMPTARPSDQQISRPKFSGSNRRAIMPSMT
jgi:hypothetical protein